MIHPSKQSGRTLETWESWVDEAIRDAKDRGEFDNLDGTGKPLNLDGNPLAGDRELAFHMLKNAEVLPPWMALDRDLNRAQTELDTSLEQVVARIGLLRARGGGSGEKPGSLAESGPKAILRRLWRGVEGDSAAARKLDPADVEHERRQARSRYLERAARLDQQIVEYNAALPNEIRHLERVRMTPERAARRFDAACAPVDCA